MAYRYVTGIDIDGEVLGEGDTLTVGIGTAIRVSTAGVSGIASANFAATAIVFGEVAASRDGIRLTGTESSVFVGQSGTVTGGGFGVWLGASDAMEISFRNEGTIIGKHGGVRLEGSHLDFANTGTIAIPAGQLGTDIAAVTLVSSAFTAPFLMNTGTIIAGRIENAFHKAIVGGAGGEIVHNAGLIRGRIDLGAGNDRYYGQEGFWEGSAIVLGTGQNMAYGGRNSEYFELFQDGDRLDDFVDGGDGVDSLYIHDGTEAITIDMRLTSRQDTGVGGLTLRNVEHLFTGVGNDQVAGNAEDNEIGTGAGNDTLEGGLGDDVLRSGSGTDTAVYSGSASATVDLSLEGKAQNTGYGFDTLTGIENLVGGSGNDRFTGDGVANRLNGAGGNDTLQGNAGNDTLDGGSGTNTAVFSGLRAQAAITRNGDGSVTVAGPDGTDRLYNIRLLQFEDRLEVINTAPAGLGLSAQSVAENAPVNSVVATLSAQEADGDALRYSLNPGSPFAVVGNSLVLAQALDFEAARQHSVTVQARDEYGGVTSQTFTIGVSNAVEATPFTLRGGSGADVLAGEAGGDTLYGGAGKDVLTGGAGKDVFVFDTRLNKRTNVDQIADFRTQDDSLYLDNKVFTKLGSGNFSKPKKFTADMFVQSNKARDAEDRIVYDRKTGKLYYDQDGTGSKAQVQIATLTNKALLKYSDFFVI